jgi:type II secretory pathway pseudopilin PulG
MRATRFSPIGGFTMIEVLAALVTMAAIGTIGYVAISNTKTSADFAKLESDVASINRSIGIYTASGGDTNALTGVEPVLNELKKRPASSTTLGVSGSTLDARVWYLASSASDPARAVWNNTTKRFEVVQGGGSGVKKFTLNEDLASSAPATDTTRTTVKTTSSGSGWVWDNAPAVEVASVTGATPQVGVSDTGLAVMSNLGLNTGSWTVGPSGQITFGYGYREAGYASRLALFSLAGMDIYDLNTDAGRKAFMLEAMRRILAGGTQGRVVIDASTSTAGSTSNTYNFNPGDQVAALLIPNTSILSAMNSLASYSGTLAAYSSANPSTSPLVSVAKNGVDIPSFYSKQFAMLGTNSNTYAVEDMVTTTSTTADYQDMVFTATGMTANAAMNTISNPSDFYTNAAMRTMNPNWNWDQTVVSGITQNSLHNYLRSVGVVP